MLHLAEGWDAATAAAALAAALAGVPPARLGWAATHAAAALAAGARPWGDDMEILYEAVQVR